MTKKETLKQHKERFLALSQFLKELRFSEGMTQKELSQDLQLHRNTLVRIETGKNMTVLSLFELADALNISIRELFNDIE